MNATHLWTRIVRSTGAAAGIVGLALATSSAWGGVTIASAKSDNTKTCSTASSDVVVRDVAKTSTSSSDTSGDDNGQGKDNGQDKDKDKDKDKDCSSSSSSSSSSSTTTEEESSTSSGTTTGTLPIVPVPTPTPTPHVQGPVTLGPATTATGVQGSVEALQTVVPTVAPAQMSAPAPTPNTGVGTPLEGGLLLMFGGISLLLAEKMGRVVTR